MNKQKAHKNTCSISQKHSNYEYTVGKDLHVQTSIIIYITDYEKSLHDFSPIYNQI